MTVTTIVPHAAPSSDLHPTPAELTSLARELCAAEGLCWAVALAHAERDLDPLAAFARTWDQDADWQHLQADWDLDDNADLPF